jgi:hypothetical protein
MKTIEKNSTFNIFYSEKNRQSGLSVTFDIWDDFGNAHGANVPSIEISTNGIYKLEFKVPNQNVYLLIIGTDGTHRAPMVVQVGTPAIKKVFHVHRFFEIGKTIPYEIYGTNEAVLQSGNLTEELQGFYSADVNSLTLPYYFKVTPLTKIVKQ